MTKEFSTVGVFGNETLSITNLCELLPSCSLNPDAKFYWRKSRQKPFRSAKVIPETKSVKIRPHHHYGGDGTFLGVSRRMAHYDVPFIGINAGRLGFVTDIPSDKMVEEISEILSGHYYTDTRCLLEGIQIRNGKEIYRNVAVNEICVSRGNSGGMIEVSVSVNKLPMSRQRADGLIVSTPTGSTAYALSVGGPMIYPSVACTLLIPVAPHSLANRPIVIPENSLIEITVTDMRDATLYFDMQDNSEV